MSPAVGVPGIAVGVILIAPAVCSKRVGVYMPMPTFPLERMRTLSAPVVPMARVPAAGAKIPVLASPVKANPGAAAVLPELRFCANERTGKIPAAMTAA